MKRASAVWRLTQRPCASERSYIAEAGMCASTGWLLIDKRPSACAWASKRMLLQCIGSCRQCANMNKRWSWEGTRTGLQMFCYIACIALFSYALDAGKSIWACCPGAEMKTVMHLAYVRIRIFGTCLHPAANPFDERQTPTLEAITTRSAGGRSAHR